MNSQNSSSLVLMNISLQIFSKICFVRGKIAMPFCVKGMNWLHLTVSCFLSVGIYVVYTGSAYFLPYTQPSTTHVRPSHLPGYYGDRALGLVQDQVDSSKPEGMSL